MVIITTATSYLINKSRIFCFCIIALLTSSCIYQQKNSELHVLEKSIEAHGGLDAWRSIDSLNYDKKVILYYENGSVESQVIQHHEYILSPSFSASINWVVDTVEHRILHQGDSTIKLIDGNSVNDSLILQSAFNTVMSAKYVVSQPFKLLDDGVDLTYQGKEGLEDNRSVDVLLADYDTTNSNHTKNDRWWYYFDSNSSLCVANMVNHGETFSYIKNLSYDSTTGIVFNRHRKSYRVDKDKNIEFLRAEYFYENYRIK